MEDRHRELMEKSFQAYAAREDAWWRQNRRGRWVVLEPGPGRLLKGSPRHIRDYVDANMEQRGRRFSSLSRARAFAREVSGVVRRWKRQMPKRGPWRHITNPWEFALKRTTLWNL